MRMDILDCLLYRFHAALPNLLFKKAGQRFVAIVCVFCVCAALGERSFAGEVEQLDLASISLQPAYVSPAQIRVSSCLRAVAFSPLDPNAPPPVQSVSYLQPQAAPTTIGIAVGDAGTILRSEDEGKSWWPVNNVSIATSQESGPNGGSNGRLGNLFGGGASRGGTLGGRRSRQELLSIPFCEFSDVLWLSPRDVIAVGGGYEPVTGVSRGVCVISHDAGENWHLADAHELPRLRQVRIGRRGECQAIGDPSEASGVNRFGSYDGGESWVEDMLPTSADSYSSRGNDDALAIETASGKVSVEDICDTPTGFQIAVTSHGRIFRGSPGGGHWQAVRGGDRRTAILFIASSSSTVPWALVGRETLQENRRTAIFLDDESLQHANDPSSKAALRKKLDRCRAAAAMLGISNVHSCNQWHPSGQMASAAAAEPVSAEHAVELRSRWLREHQPSVVVLDESLSSSTRRSWQAAIEQIQTRAFSIDTSETQEWSGPRRIVLTRPVGSAKPVVDADPRWQRAWNHASVLQGNALLTGAGVLANDLAVDALMLAAPGHMSPTGIEVATLADSSGSVRRDVSLAAGIELSHGQNRDEGETQTASHRRLQITTARMNQTSRLREELRGVGGGRHTHAEPPRLKYQIEQLLAVTAPDDRTRLLWEGLSESARGSGDVTSANDILLGLLAQHGQPASVRRWADVMQSALSSSIEVKASNPMGSIKSPSRRESSDGANALTQEVPRNAPESHDANAKSAQPLSPFQVAPASFLSGVEVVNAPAPRILVPETKRTVWQSTRGAHAFATPISSFVGTGDSSAQVDESEPLMARINWDYHPVVMGARGITPTVARRTGSKLRPVSNPSLSPLAATASGPSKASAPLASLSDDDSFTASAKDTSRRVPRYLPPKTRDRPLLDAFDDDSCWIDADVWHDERITAKCSADDDYLYFAIYSTEPGHVRLSLDCDGDYLTSLQFDLLPDGSRRASVNGVRAIAPVWYAAVPPHVTEDGRATAGSDSSRRMVAEVAIARSSLPAPVCRVRASRVGRGADPEWDVMPDARDWHPSRQSTPSRQY